MPNRTYIGLDETCCSAEELKEEALLTAGHSVRPGRKFSLQLGADRRQLIGVYKKACAMEELRGALEALVQDFYMVERAMISIESLEERRLPILKHGCHTGLPRAYDIAVCIVGKREGRVDEGTISRFLEAYQGVSPLTMGEIAALPDMLNAALLKLISVECAGAMEDEQGAEAAAYAAEALKKIKDKGKIGAVIERAELTQNPYMAERLYTLLREADEDDAIAALNRRLKLLDENIEAVCKRARQGRAKSRERVGNAIKSLHSIAAIDWEGGEKFCRVHTELCRDPVYCRMDGRSRGYYRLWVERLSSRLGAAETVVARQAVLLAAGREGKEGQAGWYLFMEGRERLYNSLRPDKRYKKHSEECKLAGFVTFVVITSLLLIWLAATCGLADLILAVIPAWSIAGFIGVRLWMAGAAVRVIPRLSGDALGEEKTLVVIPGLVTGEKSLRDMAVQLETHMLATRLDCCRYALLCDFPDASEERLPGENELVRLGVELIEGLNRKYPSGEPLFYYLHRRREYAAADGIYMGRERKRGALCDMVSLITEGRKEPFFSMAAHLPDGIAYCITLDGDTVLPPDSAAELIGCMEHPLNSPEIIDGVVRKGYGVISPRMAALPEGARNTPFSWIMSGVCGVDGYFPTVPEFYQDVFGCGLFGGKGIFSVEAFRNTVMEWIPENTVLSHDMLEGCFLRCGYAGDIALYDSDPSGFISWWKRQHRWMRGDWQLLPFLMDGVRDAKGVKRDNPLSWLSKRKILDNLRRGMLYGSVLFSVVFLPYTGPGWYSLFALAALLDGLLWEVLSLPVRLIRGKNVRLSGLVRDLAKPAARGLLELVSLPYAASRSGDAKRRTLYRMIFSHKKMLEWQTAAQSSGRPQGINGYYGALYINPVFGIIMTAGAMLGRTPALAWTAALGWLAMPLIIWRLDMPFKEEELPGEDKELLMDIAESTWKFFASFANTKSNYLPPDNFQQTPAHDPSINTSPTNIGMGIMSCIAAKELGIIGPEEETERLSYMADTIERMEKWHGHLYNWYRTDTLEVLSPRYVSTVDSGNLAASLLTGAQAMLEAGEDKLSLRLRGLAAGMDFVPLYDHKRRLFHIGYDGERCELSRSCYDLLASEARLTSLGAVGLGQVEAKHWFSLGRLMAPVCGRTLMSWSGTMFEYLMPVIFTGRQPGTLLWESCVNAVKAQRRYSGGDVWGVSESGYYAFDRNMYYQYRAFGIQRLSLMSRREKNRVISPYSTLLALMIHPGAAVKNIKKLMSQGMLGPYGMYEAADYTPGRLPKGRSIARVQSYMAHHQGMSICAIGNALCGWALAGYFARVPEMRAAQILTKEMIPSWGVGIRSLHSGEERGRRGQSRATRPRVVGERFEVPETQLMTNGSYTIFITDSGMGFSKCGSIMLNRWRPDHLRGNSGIHMLIRADGEAWDAAMDGETVFYPYRAEFTGQRRSIHSSMEICVSPRHNGEVRKLTLTNKGGDGKNVAVGAYMEVCLQEQAQYEAHPGFNRLTVDAIERDGALFFNKREKLGESRRWLYFKLISTEETVYASDRSKVQSRGKTLEEAMLQPWGREDVGAPVHPCAAGRSEARIEPEEGREFWLITGYAQSFRTAQEDCREMESELCDCFSLGEANEKGALAASGTEYGKAELFERMAGRLLLNIPMKGEGGRWGGLKALWELGISGDKPMMLAVISRVTELRLLRFLIEFSGYMERRLCPVDIAAVGIYPGEYRNELRERMEEMTAGAPWVRLINGYDLKEDELAALKSAAMIEVRTDVSLNRQFAARPEKSRIFRKYSRTRHEPLEIPLPELKFYNGLGGFTEAGEYLIALEPGQKTPMPWCNVIANDSFGTIVTESGGGHTWHENSRENKLTPWRDSPMTDPLGEIILITDTQSGECFSPFPGRLQRGRMTVRHGRGYSVFASGEAGMKIELTVFVHPEAPVKYSVLKVKNPGGEKRTFSVLYSVEWVLGDTPHAEAIYTAPGENRVYAANLRKDDAGEKAYIALAGGGEAETCSDRDAILKGGWDRDTLPDDHGAGSGMSALRWEAALSPGEERKFVLCLGEDTREGIEKSINEDTDILLERVKAVWRQRLDVISVHTPDGAMDAMMNGQLMYQTWASRILGRCGYYQCGGAIGFRDQLQDMLALMHHHEKLAAKHILLCASRQFKAGDVLHWWHEPLRGVRTRIADDRLFLPYAVSEYVDITGDGEILNRSVPYLTDRPIPEDRRDLYEEMEESGESESLYCHCVRAVDSIGFGSHGLPLMEGGDWNDGMDLVGENGGESMWLGWFLLDVLSRMERLAKNTGREADAARFGREREKLKTSVEEQGWDGEWYRRAYFGDGTPLGSRENPMCSIDCLSQSWAAICGGERAQEAVNSMLGVLNDEQEGIMKLLAPPFDGPCTPPVGYISEYIPGVRENGGQYTHAAAWAVLALCRMGMGKQALALFDSINPINHTLTRAQVMKYRTEPYAVAGDVYSGKNSGRGGWTWYTGSAAWLYKICLEELLGIKRRGNVLEIAPAAPFGQFTVEYRWGESLYILNLSEKSRGKVELADDGMTHEISI